MRWPTRWVAGIRTEVTACRHYALRVLGRRTLSHGVDRLNKTLDIPVPERKSLSPVYVVRVARHVIGHDHIGIVDLLEGHHDSQHVHVAFIGEDLLEVVSSTTNISEMNVENFLSRTKVTNDVVNLFSRVFD